MVICGNLTKYINKDYEQRNQVIMRDHKFRGIYEGNFVYGNLIIGVGLDGEKLCQIENTDPHEFRKWDIDPETVGEFTGRTDNHGNGIYSGDILKSLHFIEGKKKHWLYHRVEWCDRLTGWQTISRGQKGTENHGNPQLWVYLKNADCEIIGNFHQNPEHLES